MRRLERHPPHNYSRGHRLDLLVAYDRNCKEVARREEDPDVPGLYPCTKPQDYGYGYRQCP